MKTQFVEVDSRGDFLPIPIEVDEQGWRVKRCETHAYFGVPPCPHPDCQTSETIRGFWVGYRVSGFGREGDNDVISFGEERIFKRDRHHPHTDAADGYYWRELAYKDVA